MGNRYNAQNAGKMARPAVAPSLAIRFGRQTCQSGPDKAVDDRDQKGLTNTSRTMAMVASPGTSLSRRSRLPLNRRSPRLSAFI